MTDNLTSHAWQQFARETTDHQLIILHDDGLYRHLRMQKPGTRMWSWDVITWPGSLATSGDIADGFTFRRLEDMFEFFGPARFHQGVPEINPGYWAEKLANTQRASAQSYSKERFLESVDRDIAAAHDVDLDGETAADLRSSARDSSDFEFEALDWWQTHGPSINGDWWESTFKDYDHHFLLTCFAIVTTISAYREAKS